MFTAAAVMLSACLGAISFRVRGGWLGDLWGVPGQSSRLLYATILAGVVLAAGWPWPVDGWRLALLALALVAAWFAGAVALGTLGAIDSGRNEHSRPRDFAMNSLRGVVYALPAAIVLAAFRSVHGDAGGAWWAAALPLAGLLQGPAYELAHTLRPMPHHPATVYAEFAVGGCLGASAALAAMAG